LYKITPRQAKAKGMNPFKSNKKIPEKSRNRITGIAIREIFLVAIALFMVLMMHPVLFQCTDSELMTRQQAGKSLL
jgi:hypothetical protein